MNFYIETLGCARNQVDSEVMTSSLLQAGFFLVSEALLADIIVVNTCGFVESAIDESMDVVLELAQFKKDGICKRLVVVGCLPERFRKEKFVDLLPEVDFFLGTDAFDKIAEVIKSALIGEKYVLHDSNEICLSSLIPRTRKLIHTAYLKIAEGCNRHCSYCVIPKLRGRQKSRPMNQIISEAEGLIESGAREITLVSQNTTDYGRDLFDGSSLDILLSNLSRLSRNIWIRFLYGHPESITSSVIETVSRNRNLCPYFDLPIQHVSTNVLKNMGRTSRKEGLISLLRNIRSCVPEAVLRTTLIVGFPGENNDNFAELLDFLDLIRFDNLGVFTYSDSDDLQSHILPNHVDIETACYRRDTLMSRQLEISRANLRRFVGKTMDVLIEITQGTNIYEGRTMMQAPEVDGITYVHTVNGHNLKIGDIVPVRVVDSLEYDLIGEFYE